MKKEVLKFLIIFILTLAILSISVMAYVVPHVTGQQPEVRLSSTQEASELMDFAQIHEELDRLEDSFAEVVHHLTALHFEPKPVNEAQEVVSRGDNPRSDALKMAGNLTRPSGVSADRLNKHLAGTNLEGLGEYFVAAENLYHVNAVFLCALGIHESGWGRSAIYRDKNNMFGFGAFDGSAYESAITFDTPEDGIFHVAGHLSHNYLTPGGSLYNGVSIQAVNRRYATDTEWHSKITSTMIRLLR